MTTPLPTPTTTAKIRELRRSLRLLNPFLNITTTNVSARSAGLEIDFFLVRFRKYMRYAGSIIDDDDA